MIHKKINVLQTAIRRLEAGEIKYNWHDTEQCNCGIVAQVAGNLTEEQLAERTYDVGRIFLLGIWSNRVGSCKTTGVKLSEILEFFNDNGFTDNDILHLEGLSNPRVVSLMGNDYETFYNPFLKQSFLLKNLINAYANRDVFIVYLKAWVKLLESEKPKSKPKIDKSIFDIEVAENRVDELIESSNERIY